jgi:hypothetical protein
MTNDQLRTALKELNGERDLHVIFAGVFTASLTPATATIKNAMLIPDEEDHLVKVTDGKSIYIFDAEKVASLRIG